MRIPRWLGSVAMASAFLLAALALWVETFRDDYHLSRATNTMGPAFYPRIVLTGVILLAVVVIAGALRSQAGRVGLDGAERLLGLIAVTSGYALGVDWIGFLAASFLFVIATSVLLGYRRLVVVVPVAAIYAVAVWYLFQRVLLIILPSSPWFDSF